MNDAERGRKNNSQTRRDYKMVVCTGKALPGGPDRRLAAATAGLGTRIDARRDGEGVSRRWLNRVRALL